jgi:hypothetical protein
MDLMDRITNVQCAFVEIDLVRSDAGNLSVSRERLVINQSSIDAFQVIAHVLRQTLDDILQRPEETAFSLLNHRIGRAKPTTFDAARWIDLSTETKDTRPEWAALNYPLIDSVTFAYSGAYSGLPNLTWQGRPVLIVASLSDPNRTPTTTDWSGTLWMCPLTG